MLCSYCTQVDLPLPSDHKGEQRFFRQTEELKLLSSRQHGLLEAWTLRHVLDESSPLFGLHFEEHPANKIHVFTLSVDGECQKELIIVISLQSTNQLVLQLYRKSPRAPSMCKRNMAWKIFWLAIRSFLWIPSTLMPGLPSPTTLRSVKQSPTPYGIQQSREPTIQGISFHKVKQATNSGSSRGNSIQFVG